MPTFGRRQALLNNAIACFESQTHADKTLLIYDDLGTLLSAQCDVTGIEFFCGLNRANSIGEKYNRMLAYANQIGIKYDAVAVWDDDDFYNERFLTYHALTLSRNRWSKPSEIWSAYHNPPAIENASGRFHGSIAINKDLLDEVGGWIDTKRATFDQEFLQLLSRRATPGDPCHFGPTQYCYRWQTSQAGHCSGLMGDPDWYDKYKPDSTEPIDRLWAELDADSIRIARHCGGGQQ